MESPDVNHNDDHTDECHPNTWEGRFNEMKGANEAQNAKFNESSRKTEQ